MNRLTTKRGIDLAASYAEVSKEKGFTVPRAWADEGTKPHEKSRMPSKKDCSADCGFGKKPAAAAGGAS